MMKRSDFYYDLPEELIAQEPLSRRDSSRLMVLDRSSGVIRDRIFRDIIDCFSPGDMVVLNDTKVLPVRLHGRRKTGGRVEIFLLEPRDGPQEALVRPSKKIKEGEVVVLDGGSKVTVHGKGDVGRLVSFDAPVVDILESGHMPLPPYITRPGRISDRRSYQTVYAAREGAAAAPTAGLHFTAELLEKIKNKGISLVYVTLHTGYGTFSPVKAEHVEDHKMHSEYFEISSRAAEDINRVKSSGGKVFAIGTTSTRVLESAAGTDGRIRPFAGETNIFIYPGYKFKIIDGLVTNFHLPESTLIMLVCALAGKEFVLEAYKRAVEKRYRFFSYGDAMLVM